MSKIIFLCSIGVVSFSLLGYGLLFGFQNHNSDDLSKIVLEGSIDVTDNKVESISLWDRGEKSKTEKFNEPEDTTMIVVDVLNCAGYLGSAKAIYDAQSTYWKLEIIPETIAADGVEKIRACDSSPESKYISSNAFAVAPSDNKRRQGKLNKLERPSIYTLPLSIQIWAKGDVTNWADTDGDGKIDLVSISGLCGTSENNYCSKTLSWNGLRWVEIAYAPPA